MENNTSTLFDDSLCNFDDEWDSVSTNEVRAWYEIKNVLRTNKGKPIDNEFDLSSCLNLCKPKSCIRSKHVALDFQANSSLTKRTKRFYESTPHVRQIQPSCWAIKYARKERELKLTATKVDDNLNEIIPKVKRWHIKSESPTKKKLKKIHYSEFKNLDSTRIISKLQELENIND